ncbi:MAG: hypothetical protein ABUK01_16635 [Leptospirales bacterium]
MDQPKYPLDTWESVGETISTKYFLDDKDILIVIPDQGSIDDEVTALENVNFIIDFSEKIGSSVGTVIYLTNLRSQDTKARKIYSKMDSNHNYATGLVVTNLLSRAIGSFFIGLSKPPLPSKLFSNYEDAIEWIKTQRPKN